MSYGGSWKGGGGGTVCCAQIFLNPAGGPQRVKLGLVWVGGDVVAFWKVFLKLSVADIFWYPNVLDTRINNIDQWELVSGASGWISAR